MRNTDFYNTENSIKKEAVCNLTFPRLEAVTEAHISIIKYLASDELEYEERFCELCEELETLKPELPESLYEKLAVFVNETLSQIVYEPEKAFPKCYTDEIGFRTEDGSWRTHNEECTQKMCLEFLRKRFEFENQTINIFAQFDIRLTE